MTHAARSAAALAQREAAIEAEVDARAETQAAAATPHFAPSRAHEAPGTALPPRLRDAGVLDRLADKMIAAAEAAREAAERLQVEQRAAAAAEAALPQTGATSAPLPDVRLLLADVFGLLEAISGSVHHRHRPRLDGVRTRVRQALGLPAADTHHPGRGHPPG